MSQRPVGYTLGTFTSAYQELIRDIDNVAKKYGADPEGPEAEHFRRLLADYRSQYQTWVNAQKTRQKEKSR